MLCAGAVLIVIDEWVHHPEFYVLDISFLEVVLVELAHHTAPCEVLVALFELTVVAEVGIEVIWSAFLWIVCQVENVERCRCSAVGALAAVRIQLTDIYLTNVVVGELVEVILDVRRRK